MAAIRANTSRTSANWNKKQKLRNAALLGQGQPMKYWETSGLVTSGGAVRQVTKLLLSLACEEMIRLFVLICKGGNRMKLSELEDFRFVMVTDGNQKNSKQKKQTKYENVNRDAASTHGGTITAAASRSRDREESV